MTSSLALFRMNVFKLYKLSGAIVIDTQPVSYIFHTYNLYRSMSSYIWNDKNTSQIHSALSTQRPDVLRYMHPLFKSNGHPLELCKNTSSKTFETSDFGALSVRPFGLFDEIEFSIDRPFQKCFIFIKSF